MEGVSLQHIDFEILKSLEKDGRISFVTLSDQVGLSKTPCWQRVRALEEEGIIRGYRALIDRGAVNLKLSAFIQVMMEPSLRSEFESAVAKYPFVVDCFTTAGEGDYLMKVVASDVEHLDKLLKEELSLLPGVIRTSTTICMRTIKEDGLLTAAAQQLRQGSASKRARSK